MLLHLTQYTQLEVPNPWLWGSSHSVRLLAHAPAFQIRVDWRTWMAWQKSLTDQCQTVKRLFRTVYMLWRLRLTSGKLTLPRSVCLWLEEEPYLVKNDGICLSVELLGFLQCLLLIFFGCSQYRTVKGMGSRIKSEFESHLEHIFPPCSFSC